MEIDRNSLVALKYQVYEAVKESFITDFKPGMTLPTESELAKDFDVALGTVRFALDRLVKEEIIYRRSGKGSFLTEDFYIKVKSYRIGIILSSEEFSDMVEWNCSWAHNMEMINGMMEQAGKLNILTKLIPEENLSLSYSKNFDGYIVWGPLKEKLKNMLHGPCFKMRYDIDLDGGFSLLGKTLAQSEVLSPAFIGGEEQKESRLNPLNRELQSAGLDPINQDHLRWCQGREIDGYKAALSLIDSGLPFDSLVCSTDFRALGALEALKERGLRVPEDVRLFGFDGIRKTEISDPPLSTCSFDWQYPGDFAMRYIRAILDGSPLPEYILPQGDLIIRRSSEV